MGKHYRAAMFEGKKIKRRISLQNINRILWWGKERNKAQDKGCVCSLCGPAVETHVKEFLPMLRCKSELLVAEWDRATAKSENIAGRIKTIGDKRIVFYLGDLWKGIRQHYISKRGWDHKHVLFDLDFCITVDDLLAQRLQKELKQLARSKLPRLQGFWMFLTFLQRGDLDKEYWDFANKIGRIFHEAGWQISYHHVLPYRDGHNSAPMCNIVFRFHWNYKQKGRTYR